MKVPLLDLVAQYNSISHQIEPELLRVARTQMCILGKDVESLEISLANYLNVKNAITVSSGSDALLMSLMLLGIEPGDEVIMPTFSFFATAGSVARLGATPIFVDSELDTFNIDTKKIEDKITDKTKAIIPVHLYGQSVEMNEIMQIAKKHNLFVIEDAAQSLGTQYKDDKFVGSIGDLGCFSFYPSKNLGAFGDGGLITTNNDEYATKLKQMRNHGMNPKYYHKFIGGNFRLDAIQAAVLNVKLPYLDSWHKARQKNAELYNSLFAENGLIGEENSPMIIPKAIYQNDNLKNYHIYHQYTIQAADRDSLKDYLTQNEIGSDIYYPIPFHRQECFGYLNCNENEYPIANKFAERVISLPVYPELTEEQIRFVVKKITEFYHKK
jgi:dTDP-4-amino-4,6-dideoxygalactose transaminase